MAATPNNPYLVQPREACHIVFEWISPDACEQCLESQVMTTYSPCEKGKRNTILQ